MIYPDKQINHIHYTINSQQTNTKNMSQQDLERFPLLGDNPLPPIDYNTTRARTATRNTRSSSLGVQLARFWENQRERLNSVGDQGTLIASIRDYVKENYPSLQVRKFIAAIIWGIIAVSIFQLIFWPRTSLGRDYRRIHFSTLSKDETERLVLKTLTDENHASEYLLKYTNSPHLAGGSDELRDFTISKFKEFGFSPYLKKYYTYVQDHVDNRLTLVKDDEILYEATLEEDPLEEDPATRNPKGIKAYHGNSASGNVTAQYVYANYGSLDDYSKLKAARVDIKDKIHVIRYGKLFPGLKIKNAFDAGAIGAVMYNDPGDDGEVTVKNGYRAYPLGPARNPSAIQRGSVHLFTDWPGDPTTPGYPSHKNARRVDPSDKLPKIPSLPISYRDAEVILSKLNGRGSKLGWKGGLDVEYSTGPSEFVLNLYNEQKSKIKEITNILFEIPGLLNEKVVLGNHRDSLTVSGAGDPNSGSAILLEVARAFGSLVKQGWKPLRTIVVASWDGGEFGMLGSTEYGEENYKDLQNNAVAYLNLDVGISGDQLRVDSNPLLDHFLIESSKVVPYKNFSDEVSLFDVWQNQSEHEIRSLRGGDDSSVFQYHLGIPSCSVCFVDGDAIHHEQSTYDSFYWVKKFVDRDFSLHNTLAKYVAFLAISFSEHEVIEYKISHYAELMLNYYDRHILQIPKELVHEESQLLEQVRSHLFTFQEVSKKFDNRAEYLQTQISIDYAWFMFFKKLKLAIDIKWLGNRSRKVDRLFLDESGLDGREWMKHTVLAPSSLYGFEGDTLPGLHDAIRRNDKEGVVSWLRKIDSKVKQATKNLKL